jgi:hypothetical protein
MKIELTQLEDGRFMAILPHKVTAKAATRHGAIGLLRRLLVFKKEFDKRMFPFHHVV